MFSSLACPWRALGVEVPLAHGEAVGAATGACDALRLNRLKRLIDSSRVVNKLMFIVPQHYANQYIKDQSIITMKSTTSLSKKQVLTILFYGWSETSKYQNHICF